MVLRAVLAWLPMIAIAFANGALREGVLRRFLGDTPARQVSTVLLLIFFAVYMAWASRRWPVTSAREAMLRGAIWLVLTLVFEFGLGAVTGKTFASMIAEYDVLRGRIWILVPLWVAIAPLVLYRIGYRGAP